MKNENIFILNKIEYIFFVSFKNLCFRVSIILLKKKKKKLNLKLK